MSDALLVVRGLRVEYGSTVAVVGLDLTIGARERVTLVGANGAGKTSTLRAISRLAGTKGSIEFAGEDITKLAAEDVSRRGIIHVPEGRQVFPTLTVHENLLVGESARRGRAVAFTLDDVYDLFPALGPLRTRAGWSLSGGEQQMLVLGRALVGSPRLLLLDEPSLGLAPILVERVMSTIRQIGEVVPILLVEQNTSAALSVCSRGIVLANGVAVMEGNAEDFEDRAAILASYLGAPTGLDGDETSIDEIAAMTITTAEQSAKAT